VQVPQVPENAFYLNLIHNRQNDLCDTAHT
jgi:hypothetical protein